ncbi:hypothetical protein [Streptomyces sp. NPDC046909]|uniref:hypothetical protein n=1 Tax=Streptomyces sp. NPDC046909 TaxID=3155617 RepID=UPI0033E1E96F
MAAFAEVEGPVRARAVCEAIDLPITPSSVNNLRPKLKRLVALKILVETEPGLFTRPGQRHLTRTRDLHLYDNRNGGPDIESLSTLSGRTPRRLTVG